MQPRFSNATPQMMQRHTGTAWQQGDYVRPKKNPLPVPGKDGDLAERAEQTLKELSLQKTPSQNED